jgi:hypothetical protein
MMAMMMMIEDDDVAHVQTKRENAIDKPVIGPWLDTHNFACF